VFRIKSRVHIKLSLQILDNIDPNDSLTGPPVELFTDIFTTEEACVLVDLLKLGVANRAGLNAKEAISSMLLGSIEYLVKLIN